MGLGIVRKEKTEYTVDKLKDLFPSKKNTITQETVDMLNDANNDPEFNGDEFVENLLTYGNVMLEGNYSMRNYINALKFCAYLETEDTVTDAYRKARANDQFVIDRRDVDTESMEYRELTNAASRFRRTPMVQKILTQSDMPLHLMFQSSRYEAVAVLAKEMVDAAYSKDRISAADKLLTHVKPPDNVQVELSVGMNAETKDMQTQLNDQLAILAHNQRKMLDQGYVMKDVQKLGDAVVIDAEVVE
jgi:hypothetical protein